MVFGGVRVNKLEVHFFYKNVVERMVHKFNRGSQSGLELPFSGPHVVAVYSVIQCPYRIADDSKWARSKKGKTPFISLPPTSLFLQVL